MKVLIVRNYPSYMDVSNNTYNIQEIGLAKALVKKGHQCDVLFWTNKNEKEILIDVVKENKIIVYYRHAVTFLKNALFLKCTDLFESYDVIQTSEYNQFGSLWLAEKYSDKTVIYHGPYYSRFNKRYNLFCKVFDVFFIWVYKKNLTRFITKSLLAEEYLFSKGIKKSQIKSIGVGIDADMLIDPEHKEDTTFYSKMKNNKNAFKVLYVGKFERRRDIIYVLNVIEDVYEKNKNVKLYMIGTGKKEYVDMVFNYITKHKLNHIIIWQEMMEQKFLGKVYEIADALILPTEYEIFGMVILESMYYKTVVLTTDNGGSRTLIKNGINGFILSKSNINDWVNKILCLMGDANMLKNLKENAKKTVEYNYTWDHLVQYFISVYDDIINGQ